MRLLRAFWIFIRRVRPISEPTWTPADQQALHYFRASHTGRKLDAVLKSQIAAANERAAFSKGSAFDCGWACGFNGLYSSLEAFSAYQEGSPTSETESEQWGEPELESTAP